MSAITVDLLQRQNRQLREQIEERDETIRQLREQLETVDELPEWLPHRTRTQKAFLLALAPGRLRSKQALLTDVYGLDPNPPSEKIVDVMICKLRASLADTPIKIVTIWGQGYQLTPNSVAALRGNPETTLHNTNSVSGGTAQPTSRPMADVATVGGNRSHQ